MEEKKKSRTYFAIKNVIFNFGYQMINTVTNLIVPPLLISTFGSVTNGLVSTIRQIVNYIQLVGAGISESSVVSLYKPLAEKDEKKISEIYKASAKTFQSAGAIFSCLAILIALIYPFFLKEELSYFSVVAIVLILSVAGASEFFAIGKYRALLTADQKIYVINIAQSVGAIFTTVATIIMIKFKFNIVMVQFVAMFAYLLRVIVLYYYFKKNYTYIDKKAKPDYSAVAKRKDATIHQLSSLIIFGSQTILISKFCGLSEASVYAVYATVFNGINTILSTISSAMLAGIGNLMATDEKEKVAKIYDIYEFLYYILVFVCYITTYVMIKSFIGIYIGTKTDVNYIRTEIIVLFTIMGLLNCMRTPGATTINAKGHYGETRNRALIEMSICLVSEIILVLIMGLPGILLGTILAYSYRTLDVIIYSNRKILDRKCLKTFRRIGINILIMLLILWFVKIDVRQVSNFLYWIGYAIMVMLGSGVVVIVINSIFNKEAVMDSKEYLWNIVKRGKK